ncbi:hypothetical protein LPJ73_000644 [Coemansia sp. RSA 2703]|nr:hypothetical protein LPJ73_000644 [Coemansia sp. RSA 2703]KAJ2377791.1 hypothetical protein IW150_001181 [Coemansia sp. RSA 2607]KAJ2398182.1 hypothetical protein GGI05_000238 [Coemansia sp. RSA 2603]
MVSNNYSQNDVEMMRLAIAQARKCTDVSTAYNVGAVIIDKDGQILSTGYSRQFPGNTHAEQCALMALQSTADSSEQLAEALKNAIMYTTMEPCSKRLSGNVPCVQRILDCGIRKVFVGIMEPPNFVECSGVEELENAGVTVVHVTELEQECKHLNSHLVED